LLQEASFAAHNFVPLHLVIRPHQNVVRPAWYCWVQAVVKEKKVR